jgi:heme-degrading monooxygenase HmoA
MTAIVIARYRSNAAEFERTGRRRPGDFEALAELASAEGCLHHRVAVGDDDRDVISINEWPDAEAFNRFSVNPAVIDILQAWGLDDPPQADYYHTIDSPGEF